MLWVLCAICKILSSYFLLSFYRILSFYFLCRILQTVAVLTVYGTRSSMHARLGRTICQHRVNAAMGHCAGLWAGFSETGSFDSCLILCFDSWLSNFMFILPTNLPSWAWYHLFLLGKKIIPQRHKLWNTFSRDLRLFFPISVNSALRKTLTYPSTLRGAYPKRRSACHDIPLTLKWYVGKISGKRGSGENAPFVGKSPRRWGKKYIPKLDWPMNLSIMATGSR